MLNLSLVMSQPGMRSTSWVVTEYILDRTGQTIINDFSKAEIRFMRVKVTISASGRELKGGKRETWEVKESLNVSSQVPAHVIEFFSLFQRFQSLHPSLSL